MPDVGGKAVNERRIKEVVITLIVIVALLEVLTGEVTELVDKIILLIRVIHG